MSDILTQPTPKSDADYEATIQQMLAEMDHVEEQMDKDRAESERLKADIQAIKAETDIIKARTAIALSQLMQHVNSLTRA